MPAQYPDRQRRLAGGPSSVAGRGLWSCDGWHRRGQQGTRATRARCVPDPL